MIYTALIGNPVDHSVSPVLFEWLSKNTPSPIEYRHIKINVNNASELESTLDALKTLHFSGINVTLPYKLDVARFLTSTDISAQEIGAINTIVFKGDEAIGYNTDWYGIYASITQQLKQFLPQKAVIFGSGGAARAAIYACLQLGTKVIVVVHRAPDSKMTEALKAQYKNNSTVQFAHYNDVATHVNDADFIINATPAGMKHQEATPFDLELLGSNAQLKGKVFFDCVFNPVRTPLLEYFESRGATVIDGLWMMIFQGLQAFSLWTGILSEDAYSQNTLLELHDLLDKEVSHEN